MRQARFLFLLICIWSGALQAASMNAYLDPKKVDPFCQNTEGLDQLRAYLICQSSENIESCAGLATPLSKRPMALLADMSMQKSREQLRIPLGMDQDQLTRKLHLTADYVVGSLINSAPTQALDFALVSLVDWGTDELVDTTFETVLSYVPSVFGWGAFVVGYSMNTTPTACSSRWEPLIHTDLSCQPVYEFNPNVVKFLGLPRLEQKSLLRFEGLCDYYKRMHQKHLGQPEFTGLSCQAGGFVLKTRQAGEEETVHEVKYHRGVGPSNKPVISQMKLMNDFTQNPWAGWDGFYYSFNKQGNAIQQGNPIRDALARGRMRQFFKVKTYLMDAYACCNTTDPKLGRECYEDFNRVCYGSLPPATASSLWSRLQEAERNLRSRAPASQMLGY